VLSEIQNKMAFDILRYSVVWEDIELLYRGLDIQPDDAILSITSAGDNVFNMLLKKPKSITAIDLNAAQNALLELKIEGIRNLEWSEFTDLIGLTGNGLRLTIYEKVRKTLSQPTLNFWDNHTTMIEKGVIDQGRLEKYFAGFYRETLPNLHSAEKTTTLLSFEDTGLQKKFYEEAWETSAFVEAFQKYFGREHMAEHGRDAAQFDYVNMDSGRYFADRFKYVCTEIFTRNNFYLHRFLTGSYGPMLPPYLKQDNFGRLKKLISRVNVVTDSIEGLTKSSGRMFTKGNFSDMFEYMSEPNMEKLLQNLHTIFKRGGRMAYWCLLVQRSLPASLVTKFKSHAELAGMLWRQDRSWFYRDFHLLEFL